MRLMIKKKARQVIILSFYPPAKKYIDRIWCLHSDSATAGATPPPISCFSLERVKQRETPAALFHCLGCASHLQGTKGLNLALHTAVTDWS